MNITTSIPKTDCILQMGVEADDKILPPQTAVLEQLIAWLENHPRSETTPDSETLARGLFAVCVRWGTYLAALMDDANPLVFNAGDEDTSCVSNREMRRINIEASYNMEQVFRMAHKNKNRAIQLLLLARDHLPVPKLDRKDTTDSSSKMIMQCMRFSALASMAPVNQRVQDNPYRALANILVNISYRNGPVEDVHAGSQWTYGRTRRFTSREERLVFTHGVRTLEPILRSGLPWSSSPKKWSNTAIISSAIPYIFPSNWSFDQASAEID
jgi:hypothetical protein